MLADTRAELRASVGRNARIAFRDTHSGSGEMLDERHTELRIRSGQMLGPFSKTLIAGRVKCWMSGTQNSESGRAKCSDRLEDAYSRSCEMLCGRVKCSLIPSGQGLQKSTDRRKVVWLVSGHPLHTGSHRSKNRGLGCLECLAAIVHPLQVPCLGV